MKKFYRGSSIQVHIWKYVVINVLKAFINAEYSQAYIRIVALLPTATRWITIAIDIKAVKVTQNYELELTRLVVQTLWMNLYRGMQPSDWQLDTRQSLLLDNRKLGWNTARQLFH